MNKLILFLSIIILPFITNAQSFERNLIGSAGDQSVNGSISLDWSIGETMVTDFQNSTVKLTQGLNQWMKIITATRDLPEWQDDILIYPNPFTDKVTLKSNGLRNYTIELYNVSGNSILKQQWDGKKLDLQTGLLFNGIYYFLIKDSSGKFIILKAVKQNSN